MVLVGRDKRVSPAPDASGIHDWRTCTLLQSPGPALAQVVRGINTCCGEPDLASQSWRTWATSVPAAPSPVSHRRRPPQELTVRQRPVHKAHARHRCPAERGIARLEIWWVFRKARCGPTWLTATALTLENYR